MKKVAISQPRYLPAINYFQRIHISDIFVILDNVQHQRRSFEHRNKIKLLSGDDKWISMPIYRAEGSRKDINLMKFSSFEWVEEHKSILRNNYRKAAFFDNTLLNEVYGTVSGLDFVDNIQNMNIRFCELFNINYNFIRSSTLGTTHQRDKLLHEIVKKLDGGIYISGANGRDYISRDVFSDVDLVFHDFEFPRYEQICGDFLPWMCIWDQVFNLGIKETAKLIKSNIILNDD